MYYVFYLESCMCFLTRRLYEHVCVIPIGWYIPYSTKFSRDKIFTDRPLTNFRINKFHGSRIPVSHAQHYLVTVAAMLCSAARFALLVELRLGSSWFVRSSSSTTLLKLETPPN